VLLYPEGVPSDALRIQADLTVPAGWRVGTALPPAGAATGDHLRFGTVTLSTLLDSPAIMGLHFRTVDLGGTPSHQAHFTADTEAALDLTAASRQALRDLVAETGALFGARHYAHYDFLVTTSPPTASSTTSPATTGCPSAPGRTPTSCAPSTPAPCCPTR